jgi:hypothetical protein
MGRPTDEPDGDVPRIAADLAILDVLLKTPASRIDANGDSLTTVRTNDIGRAVRRSVSDGKILFVIGVIA